MKMYRVEDKYDCTVQEMVQLQHRLSMALRADDNEEDAKGYQVASLYFDDLADSCLNATKEGSDRRCKYRIRIYNGSFETIKLEVKEKKGSRIWKKSRRITEGEMRQLICGQCIQAYPAPEDPAFLFNAAIQTRLLRPKVAVAYERKAYIYDPGNVRITFDRSVRASRQVMDFGVREMVYDALPGQDAVLEIKYDELLTKFIQQLLELESIRQTAYSKYQLCRERYEATPVSQYLF